MVRVLNLWQKNGIYPPDVISPLVDMASTSSRVLAVQILKQKKKKFASSKPDDVEKNLLDETSAFEESFTAPCEPEVDLKKDKKKIQMSQDDEIQVLKVKTMHNSDWGMSPPLNLSFPQPREIMST